MTEHIWYTNHGSAVIFNEGDNDTFIGDWDYADGGKIKNGDRRILQAARVSNKGYNTGMTKKERDEALIKYLWKNDHSSVFEHCHLTFTVITDLRIAMQMDTHRTWHRNRYSRRYSHDWVEFCTPQWRQQNSTGNKQGSDELMDAGDKLVASVDFEAHGQRSVDYYNKWIERGMAREQAAYFLPTGVLTSTFYTVDLRNLIGFIKVRAEEHAQKEIQDIAEMLRDRVIPLVAPWTYELVKEMQDA